MSKKKNSVLLEVDRSIIEHNLLIQDNKNDGLDELFPKRISQETDVPWKLVKPTPAGNPSIAYDVAINPEFYKKTENSKLFLSFLLTVVMEGLKDKYSLSLQTDDYVILKNRKVLGNLLPHRIRQGGQKKPAGPLIQEMTPPVLLSSRQPQYRIRQEPAQAAFPEYLLAEFFMKDLSSSHGLTLDVGEDRIVLGSPGRIGQQAYKLDVFIPYSVDQDRCSATFNTDTKILSLKMPVITTS
ncbi:hypothetical protein B7P43_G15135 [Cryptotermes secundus]|uniref:PIH1 domain-containing protein 1 n=1 Tax=Cryptotermes secundus TaxID=105785 RepID=A0A2J7Q8B7_9NEOP|nr:hypothetical protein B7P43_G15135 [Cryptotermes secundus]